MTAVAETRETWSQLHSETAERALLGALAYHPDAMAGVLRHLDADDFFNPHRGTVWAVAQRLHREDKPVEPTLIARTLAADGEWSTATERVVQYEMLNQAPASHAQQHADTVADLAVRRRLMTAIESARLAVVNHAGHSSELFAAAQTALNRAAPADTSHRPDAPLGWDELIDEFENVHAPGGSRPGIPTPWLELDQILGGLYGGRVYVFGGRPGHGKSTAALNLALYAAVEHGKEAFVISKEMPSVDVTGRFLAAGAEVSLAEINFRQLSDTSRAKIRAYVRQVGRPPITVDARPRNLTGIKTLLRGHHHRNGLDVVVVDYLQLVRTETPSRSREQEVAEVSRQLKELAIELDCAVVLPAQLNRESMKRADPRPTMADLRDSGQIEQDADAVILLHRPVENGNWTKEIEFIVDKNRHGATASVMLRWSGGYGLIS
jgi:replicative DNA helicase